MLVIVGIVAAYLLGSIPTGYLVARANGVNIQQIGSGNIGATNVLRAVGRGAAAIVIIADPLKGMVAVWLAMLANLGGWGTVLCGLAAVLGNNFNIFLRLKGGKGIATSIGVFIVLAPVSTSLGIVMGVFAIVLCRYVSMGSMIGMSVTPLFLALHRPEFSVPKMCLSVTLFILSVVRHRNNLERLAKGTERRIGERAGVTSPPEIPTPETSTSETSTPQTANDRTPSDETLADVEQSV
ncbi:MAG: glycerol-3-phosphate 1-O-acyltransferase PlsY [Deinococcota bacterium]